MANGKSVWDGSEYAIAFFVFISERVFAAETEGDIGPLSSSTAPSVRFDDDIQELDEVVIAQPTGKKLLK